MGHGKTIRIYLADGTVRGIRHAEVVNWTGQAIACQRSRVSELADWKEVDRPGVYFLFGTDGIDERVYIGEAESVLNRLAQHLRTKDFWNEVIAFTSKDENLTKAHVKYLESRLFDLSSRAKRYVVENMIPPSGVTLPRGDVAAMEEFLEHLGSVLGALGHRVLDARSITDASDTGTIVYKFEVREVSAIMHLTDDGLVVHAGSTAAKETAPSMGNYMALRTRLISSGALQDAGDKFIFPKDCAFASVSAAATVIAGSNRSGKVSWRGPDGKTLAEAEDAVASKLTQSS
jgi:hypothetical protein